MIYHPFTPDFSDLTDQQVDEKIKEINNRIISANHLGKNEMLTQLQNLAKIYYEERTRRFREKAHLELDKDVSKLINIK